VGPESDVLAIYQTGVQYQMYHALALLAVGLLADRIPGSLIHYAGFLFIAGVVFFSGSLYLIASLKAMNKSIPTLIGVMTPFGGSLFILGWILLLVALVKN
jgi:uncharacterized membrane protein YgdD (TMEM256/DUF423 family)